MITLSKVALTEEMLKEAFTRYAEIEMQLLPSEDKLEQQYTFSPKFEIKMKKLINKFDE